MAGVGSVDDSLPRLAYELFAEEVIDEGFVLHQRRDGDLMVVDEVGDD